MKTIAIISILSFLSISAFAQNNDDYLVVDWDTIHYSECGYLDKDGNTVIPRGRYPICLTDTFRTFAVVYKSNRGFIGINRKEDVLFKIFQYDNGPDFPSEGLFRIIEGNKLGFANIDGEVVVSPSFDAAYPFSEGLAAFCEGCKTQRVEEQNTWKNGKWGFINNKGEIVIEAQFDAINDGFKDGKVFVKKEKEKFEIDKEGNRVE